MAPRPQKPQTPHPCLQGNLAAPIQKGRNLLKVSGGAAAGGHGLAGTAKVI